MQTRGPKSFKEPGICCLARPLRHFLLHSNCCALCSDARGLTPSPLQRPGLRPPPRTFLPDVLTAPCLPGQVLGLRHLVSEAHLTAVFNRPHLSSSLPGPCHPALVSSSSLIVTYKIICSFTVLLVLFVAVSAYFKLDFQYRAGISVTFELWRSYLAPRERPGAGGRGKDGLRVRRGGSKLAVSPTPSGAPTHLCPMPAR